MLELAIPGRSKLKVANLVLDYNGTLATDGKLIAGVGERLTALAAKLDVHIITADTFGLVGVETGSLPVQTYVIGRERLAEGKAALVEPLGREGVVAMGNGANDVLMLKAATLGICVLGAEGAATATLLAADVVVRSPVDGLDLLLQPGRLAATLRL